MISRFCLIVIYILSFIIIAVSARMFMYLGGGVKGYMFLGGGLSVGLTMMIVAIDAKFREEAREEREDPERALLIQN